MTTETPLTAPPQTTPAGRIITATLILGPPGSGKTSLAESAAAYCWETYKKVLCLYVWDGGAIPTLIQKRVKQGLIRFWRVRTRSADGLGLESASLATKGYWPREINPLTGETSPAVPLVAPLTTKYAIHCKEGHLIQTIPVLALQQPRLCPTCKAMSPVAEQRVVEDVQRSRGFDEVGMVMFDGLTALCTVVTDHMDIARGQGQIGGEKSAFGGVVRSGGMAFGGNNRADIGFAQTRAQQWVANALSIPYLVEGPIFTALSMEVSDEGLTVVGPKLAGQAATDQAPAWFGNVMEMGKSFDDQGREHFALYLRPFTDKQGRRHLLKTSASPGGVPDALVDPLEAPFSMANLGNVYRMLDEDLRKNLAEDAIQGPGLPPMSYGEGLTVVPAVPAVSAPNVLSVQPTTAVVGTLATAPGLTASAATPSGVAKPLPMPTPTVARPSGIGTTTAPPPPGMKPPVKMPGS